jgi:hypothetical protein
MNVIVHREKEEIYCPVILINLHVVSENSQVQEIVLE